MLTAWPFPLKRQPWYEHMSVESDGSMRPCERGASLSSTSRPSQGGLLLVRHIYVGVTAADLGVMGSKDTCGSTCLPNIARPCQHLA